MPALMGIKRAAVQIMGNAAVIVHSIIPARMPAGAGTAILALTILDIRCTCCLTMTASLEPAFLYISVFWTQDAASASAGLLRLRNFVTETLIFPSKICVLILQMTIITHTIFAKHGTFGLLSALTPAGAGRSLSLMKLQLIRMEPLSARPVTE